MDLIGGNALILYNIRRKNVSGASPSRRNMAESTVVMSARSFPYTGSQVTPSVTVTYGSETLVVNVDYTVEYTDNVAVGLASVTVRGMDGYYGTNVATFYITKSSSGDSWMDFDITKTGRALNVASISDATATYCGTEKLNSNFVQYVSGGKIAFGALAQGHAYLWGFENGHEMELDHINASFVSRKDAVAYYVFAMFSGDGSKFYERSGTNRVLQYSTSVPFSFSNLTLDSDISLTYSGVGRMAFSGDGKHVVYGIGAYNATLYHRCLKTPWDLRSYDAAETPETSINLNANIRGFCISPDGKYICAVRTTSDVSFVRQYEMSSAGDIATATMKGEIAVKSDAGSSVLDCQGVCINGSGTKMIVWRNGGSASARDMYEYDLVK